MYLHTKHTSICFLLVGLCDVEGYIVLIICGGRTGIYPYKSHDCEIIAKSIESCTKTLLIAGSAVRIAETDGLHTPTMIVRRSEEGFAVTVPGIFVQRGICKAQLHHCIRSFSFSMA